jgi:hypothetical protein
VPAYVVTEIEVIDAERYEAYKQMVAPSIAAYGGKFLVRGGATETLEGTWSPRRLVIVEFSSTGPGEGLVGLAAVRRGEGAAPGHGAHEDGRRRGGPVT